MFDLSGMHLSRERFLMPTVGTTFARDRFLIPSARNVRPCAPTAKIECSPTASSIFSGIGSPVEIDPGLACESFPPLSGLWVSGGSKISFVL